MTKHKISALIAEDGATALVRALGAFGALRLPGMTADLLYESACRTSSSGERAILRIALSLCCGLRPMSSDGFLSDFSLLDGELKGIVLAVMRRFPS